MPKFFVPAALMNGDTVTLASDHAEHLKVLRVKPGEELLLCDGAGTDFRCSVAAVSGNTWQLDVLSSCESPTEPSVSVTIYAGLPKGDKTETIIQKAVELGAERVAFFLSSRCVARPDAKSVKGKLERWQKISEAAAMQSYRGKIPEILYYPGFREMLAEAANAELKAFLWEDARQLSLRDLMQRNNDFRTAALITGPEGGFSAEEAAEAEAIGILPVTLGKRILRCETAPLCVLSAVMYHTGNLE